MRASPLMWVRCSETFFVGGAELLEAGDSLCEELFAEEFQ